MPFLTKNSNKTLLNPDRSLRLPGVRILKRKVNPFIKTNEKKIKLKMTFFRWQQETKVAVFHLQSMQPPTRIEK